MTIIVYFQVEIAMRKDVFDNMAALSANPDIMSKLSEEQRFTTCTKQGPIGPEMEDCAKVYKYYDYDCDFTHLEAFYDDAVADHD